MTINGEKNCFIFLKDHIESFENNPIVILISLVKNKLGRKRKGLF